MSMVNLRRGEIVLERVDFRYRRSERDVLQRINFQVRPGEFVAVMGRTGAGKTTLQMLLNGLIPHFFDGQLNGIIFSNGLNTRKFRVQTLSRFIGLVMQEPETQIFGVTVEKDIAFGLGNLGFSRDDMRTRIQQVLAAVRLSGFENRVTVEMSGGEKQRLAIAGILAMAPDILVLDEPTSELDPVGKKEIFQTLADLQRAHELTIVIASHDSESILEYADRVIVLDDGAVAWDGKPTNLFKDVALVKKFGIRPPEVTELGSALCQAKIISQDDIPTNVIHAQELIQHLSSRMNFRSADAPIEKNLNQKNFQEIISVKNLYYKYETGIGALNGITLSIKQGELLALVGQNGAGKTTLVKHFNGLLKPTAGDVAIDGIDTRSSDIPVLAKKVGFVFQNPDHQIFSASVEEEVNYGLRRYGFSPEEMEKRVVESLAFVGLLDNRKRHPFTLGKGERQKLAVATVLAMSPEIIVIDEPTTGMDWEGAEKMMDMIQQLNQKGHTIIMVTHNMRIVARMAQRMIVMHQGKIEMDGTPEEIFYQAEALAKCYVVPPMTVELARTLHDYGFNEHFIDVEHLAVAFIASLPAQA